MKIVLVAAIGENNVIGREGQLPWRLKSDLQLFRKVTLNRPVIMGRKTFSSIGKSLKDRTNIVLTNNLNFVAAGVVLATSLDAALGYARDDAKKRGVDEIMVIGGSDVFAAMMPHADRLEITHVHASPEGDATFPPIDPEVWQEAGRTEYKRGADDDADFTAVTYLRR
ncbi:MAG: dihydrofolate reductase [Pseudolabrys sp.]